MVKFTHVALWSIPVCMNTQEIVAKLWNLCNVLRDDGITYHQYVSELTFILYLKMARETGAENEIPEAYRWGELVKKDGLEQWRFYRELLLKLGTEGKGKTQQIYANAQTNIAHAGNLTKIIQHIDKLDWYSAKVEGLGDLYEGLLEKNASETLSGAGQYFTPRPLINVMVDLISPKVGERWNDPAAGTFGFMIAADQYLREKTDNYYELDDKQRQFQINEAFSGCELVQDAHRLALMNAKLHGLESRIEMGDTLSELGKSFRNYDGVLANPPFGTKQGGNLVLFVLIVPINGIDAGNKGAQVYWLAQGSRGVGINFFYCRIVRFGTDGGQHFPVPIK